MKKPKPIKLKLAKSVQRKPVKPHPGVKKVKCTPAAGDFDFKAMSDLKKRIDRIAAMPDLSPTYLEHKDKMEKKADREWRRNWTKVMKRMLKAGDINKKEFEALDGLRKLGRKKVSARMTIPETAHELVYTEIVIRP